MIAKWYQEKKATLKSSKEDDNSEEGKKKSGKGPAKTKATKKKQGPAKKNAATKSGRGVKRHVHADVVIINAFMHRSATRMEIQEKHKLSDGTLKAIVIVGLMPHKSANFADIGRALLAKCKDGSGMTKGECINARDEMLAAETLAD